MGSVTCTPPIDSAHAASHETAGDAFARCCSGVTIVSNVLSSFRANLE